MTPHLTLAQYAGPYLSSADFTLERRSAAIDLLAAANAVIALAGADGVVFAVNPSTGSLVAGAGNGGFRPQSSRVGAPGSSHKQGAAVDVYDPERRFASWCYYHQAQLEAAGIRAMEDPRWTPTWVHLDRKPRLKFFFVPDSSQPKAGPVPVWQAGGAAT